MPPLRGELVTLTACGCIFSLLINITSFIYLIEHFLLVKANKCSKKNNYALLSSYASLASSVKLNCQLSASGKAENPMEIQILAHLSITEEKSRHLTSQKT